MVPSRNGPRGAEVASFGLAILLYVVAGLIAEAR